MSEDTHREYKHTEGDKSDVIFVHLCLDWKIKVWLGS